ncbi:MAG: uracil phosphoribosyltransferase [Synechococcus sp. SB0666_bin_14]|nr:uracil phosphoribosyltransferase [Synechococcus sp. SB0666_bin_14]MYA91773.1 uracil phosphoribosyltransferase [Synechococcus sp. SB0663_bin_10]MYG47419.1 uracil phosphoribosyltransferase [Synechococcus sp. SB0675_bin_6]MYJ58903.1 uracil phosphoribosyltransferase [Synechococcus sp. SB0672_bin_6]
MALTLRVVVPPHPLIAHWLTVARDARTPAPLFRTALQELGRWLAYEALRDWLPHHAMTVTTPLGQTTGHVVDQAVDLAVVPVLRAGLGLWDGAQAVLPHARVWHVGLRRGQEAETVQWYYNGLPDAVGQKTGVLVLDPILARGATMLAVLERLKAMGVEGKRLRVITALCSAPGLQQIGSAFPDLVITTACIDPELDPAGFIVPGLGDAGDRLFGTGDRGCFNNDNT